jgi:hypothetical protein
MKFERDVACSRRDAVVHEVGDCGRKVITDVSKGVDQATRGGQ